MEHSPAMKYLGMATWFITAVAAINMLTGMYEYNLLLWIGNMMPGFVIPMCWIIGVSGIISLVMLIKAVMMCASGACCSSSSSYSSCGCPPGACNCR